MKINTLLEKWEASLCHANANYQMIVMAELGKYSSQSLENLQIALAKANPTKTPKFFNKNHRVFEVLQKKGMIKAKENKDGLVYILNCPPTVENMALIRTSAIKAKQAFEVSH